MTGRSSAGAEMRHRPVSRVQIRSQRLVKGAPGSVEHGQTRRLKRRIEDPRKVGKLSARDPKSCSRWCGYSRARDAMFVATGTVWASWYIAHTDGKKRGRLNLIGTCSARFPTGRSSLAARRCLSGTGPAAT